MPRRRKAQEKQELNEAVGATQVAVNLLRGSLPLMQEFLIESTQMESVGPVLAPSLYMDSERRATEAVVKPIFEAAVKFVADFDNAVERARSALETVSRG